MAGTYIRYPSSGGTTINKYANATLLPATAADGTLAITLNNHNLLEFFSSDMMWHVIGSSSFVGGVGVIDSNGASANGATVNGSNQIVMQSASASVPGLVNTAAQTFAGVKTFSSAPNLSSLTASLPLQLDASKNVISSAIDLSTPEITGLLPFANLGPTPGSTTFYVDKNRVDSYTADGTVMRPFKTIQAAVNQVIANGDNTTSKPYTINIVGAGLYAENVTLNSLSLVSIAFSGANSGGAIGGPGVTIQPASGDSVNATSNVSNLQALSFDTIAFQGPVRLNADVNGSNFGFIGISFLDCIVNSASDFSGIRILTCFNTRTSTWSTYNILSATSVNVNHAGTLGVVVDLVGHKIPVGFTTTSAYSGRAVGLLQGYTDSVGVNASFYNIVGANATGQTFLGAVQAYGGSFRGPITISSGASLTIYGTFLAGTVSNSGTFVNNNNLKDADIAAAAAVAVNKLAALTVNRAVASDSSGFLTVSATTDTELGYVNGVTSSIQTQLNAKEPTVTKGNLTDVGTDGIVITGGTGAVIGSGTSIAQQVADTTHNGYLSSTDWNTFNGKQASGNYITALTGDATASGPGSVALTLATVNSNVGSFGSSTSIPSLTVNAKGLVTAASGNVVIAPAGTLSGTTLNSTVVSSSLTSVGTIASGTWNGTTIAIANGGTGQTTKAAAFDALQPMTTGGDIIYGGASGTGTRLANGSAGQVLTSAGTTLAPTWAAVPVANLAVTAQTGTYSILTTDSVILCSGAAFTVTLPTAVGVTGKQYKVKKTDSSPTNIITIATTSSQTIDGNTTRTLNTQFECWSIVSDGANWQVTDHDIPATWGTYTATYTGFGTPTATTSLSRRVGDSIELMHKFTIGTSTNVEARVSLPSGVTSSSLIGSPTLVAGCGFNGSLAGSINTLSEPSVTYVTFSIESATANSQTKVTGTAIGGAGTILSFTCRIPVSGWEG